MSYLLFDLPQAARQTVGTHPGFLDIEDVPQSFDFEYLFLTKNCTLNKISSHNHITSSDPHQLTYILTCYLTFYLAFHLSI